MPFNLNKKNKIIPKNAWIPWQAWIRVGITELTTSRVLIGCQVNLDG